MLRMSEKRRGFGTSLLVAAVVSILFVVGLAHASNPPIFDGYQGCGKRIDVKTGKAFIEVKKVSCKRGARLARAYYRTVGTKPDGKNGQGYIYYRVKGFKCFTGLGGSEGYCHRKDGQRVFMTTNSDYRTSVKLS